ncbi:MAG: hypothetical protein AAB421_02955 [Patescibacteria group bacterium]|mgnify:CR=1 FL=1
MKSSDYAQALLTLVERGSTPRDAVQKLVNYCERKGIQAALPRIRGQVARVATKRTTSRIEIARESDAPLARKAAEVACAEHHIPITDLPIVIDETLIGGSRVIAQDMLMDTSYKHQLLKLYHSLAR